MSSATKAPGAEGPGAYGIPGLPDRLSQSDQLRIFSAYYADRLPAEAAAELCELADEWDEQIASAPAPSDPAGAGGDLEKLADDYVLRVSELEGRTSPLYVPEAILLTLGELRCELLAFGQEVLREAEIEIEQLGHELDVAKQERDAAFDQAQAGVEGACKPWKHHAGDPPGDDNPLLAVYDAGLTYGFDLLAKAIGLEHWTACDGSESWEGDVRGTLWNILRAARVADPETDEIARAPQVFRGPTSSDDQLTADEAREILEQVGRFTADPRRYLDALRGIGRSERADEIEAALRAIQADRRASNV